MSQSQSKAVRKKEKQALIEDLQTQLGAATVAQLEKLNQTKEHLVIMLRGVQEKYLTVNGYMQAMTTMEQAAFGQDIGGMETAACDIAHEISVIAGGLANKVEAADVMTIDESILDGYMVENFISTSFTLEGIVHQLLVIQLLQNAGPAIDDIVAFRAGTNEGIEKLNEELLKATGETTLEKASEDLPAGDLESQVTPDLKLV